MFFCNFPATGNEKKKRKRKKKNVGAEIGNGLLPKLCSDQGARQLSVGRRRARHDIGHTGEGELGRGARSTGGRAGRRGARQGCAARRPGPVDCALGALSLF